MTQLSQRKSIIDLIEKAQKKGASRQKACQVIGINIRTIQRWQPAGNNEVNTDRRLTAQRRPPANKFSQQERDAIITVCNEDEYASLPPSQIVPKLADQGRYLGSESSFYRILKAQDQLHHRGRSKAPKVKRTPTTHKATAPNQVWTWDITWLPSTISGRFYYLYMIQDLYSRYGVAWEVHEAESGENAANLMQKAMWREQLSAKTGPVLHSDNGSTMKSQTLRVKLEQLGISQSFSRPRVSDDNAYVESFFRTLKYGPMWPNEGFGTLNKARDWVQKFMQWYNQKHQHSKIRFVTPEQRHKELDTAILAKRNQVYAKAKTANPNRWTGKTRDWSPIKTVTLNPTNEHAA